MNPRTENVKELLNDSIKKLQKQIKTYEETEKEHMEILKAFGLETMIYNIPLELFTQNDIANDDYVHQNVAEKVNEESNKYFISQLDSNIATLQSLDSSLTEQQKSMNETLEKYKGEYKARSENVNQDLLNISSLQTSIHKVQADIHQANELQEQKKQIISKFEECSQIKQQIGQYREREKALMKEMESFRLLPADLSKAQEKLDQLKQKYQQICDEFSYMVQKGYQSSY